jgi:hypothetical protein
MSFSLEIPNDQISVDAGSTVPLTLVVKNQGDSADQFEIMVEGVDLEWLAIPVPMLAVEAGAQQSEKVFFKPPRASESLAGNYPFVVQVRSLTSGESRTAQGVLSIKPFHHLTIELSPKKGVVTPTRKDNVFTATIINLGNMDHSLQLFGNDPEDALSYGFAQEQIQIQPGQSRNVQVAVTPLKSKPLSSGRLHGFSIGARSIDTPSIVCSAQAQVEERPLLTPGMLFLAFFVLALFIGWFALLPKPPQMEVFSLNPRTVVQGEPVTINWRAANAKRVRIQMGDQIIVDTPQLVGTQIFQPVESGTIRAVAVRDGNESSAMTETITVNPKPILPAPKILSFDITPRQVNKGEKLTIKYRVDDNVKELVLQPSGDSLDTKIESRWITADFASDTEFWLVARNAEGKEVESRRIKITVVDPTLPAIKSFLAAPSTLESPGTVTLSWNVANAQRIEINDGSQTTTIFESTGTREFTIEKTTEFTITVYDSQERKTSKKLTVTLKPPVEPPPVTPTGGDNSTTGGGN